MTEIGGDHDFLHDKAFWLTMLIGLSPVAVSAAVLAWVVAAW